MGKSTELGMSVCAPKTKIILIGNVGDIKMAGRKQDLSLMHKKLTKFVDIAEPASFLDHVYLGCTQRECKPNENVFKEYKEMFKIRISAGATENYQGGKNLTQRLLRGPTSWKDMLFNASRDIMN